jgi:tetratricopeptide (TPR) repeat protein
VTPRRRGLLGLAIALLALGVYVPILQAGFVSFDDTLYVTANRHVQGGLTPAGVLWAFGANVASNWHPLTLLAHMLDCQLFGLDAPGHHASSLLLHLLDGVLLFAFLVRTTGEAARSALVAALFAVHPLHVESVCWVSERKDVLSAAFFLVALLAWRRWLERPTRRRYGLVALAFVLGLLAKPMVVTLPCVLLLLDVWPFGRVTLGPLSAVARRRELVELLREKLPLFGIAAASCVVTLVTQSGSMGSLAAVPVSLRVGNALVAYASYLGKTFWPARLAVFYPLPRSVPVGEALLAAGLLPGITALALLRVRRSPWLLVGWLWFAGMLVPVIGLLQVGRQAMADRYTYLPSIGLFLALAWEVPALLGAGWRRPAVRAAVGAAAVVAVALLAGAARAQVLTWRDDETLFRHAMEVTDGNYVALAKVASHLARREQRVEAERLWREALRLYPSLAEAHVGYGTALSRWGRPAEALPHLRKAARLRPNNAAVRAQLALAETRARRRHPISPSDSTLDPTRPEENEAMRHPRPISFATTLAVLLAAGLLAATGAFAADAHTTAPFAGVKVNGGTVHHTKVDGKNVLTLSADFEVPDTPDPHWQVVDSHGNVYALQKLAIKGDKVNRSITLPSYVPDVAKVQIWCAFAEVLLGEAAFPAPVE